MKKTLLALTLLLVILLSACSPSISTPQPTPNTTAPATTAAPSTDPLWTDPAVEEIVFDDFKFHIYPASFITLSKDGKVILSLVYDNYSNVSLPDGSQSTSPIDCQRRILGCKIGTYKYENCEYVCSFDGKEYMHWQLKGKDAEKYKTALLDYAKEFEPDAYQQYKDSIEGYYLTSNNEGQFIYYVKVSGNTTAILRADGYQDGVKRESAELNSDGSLKSMTSYKENGEISYVETYEINSLENDNYKKTTTRKDCNGNLLYKEVRNEKINYSIVTRTNAEGVEIYKYERIIDDNGFRTINDFRIDGESVIQSKTVTNNWDSTVYNKSYTIKNDRYERYNYEYNEYDTHGVYVKKRTVVSLGDEGYLITVTTYNPDAAPGESNEETKQHLIAYDDYKAADWETDYQ